MVRRGPPARPPYDPSIPEAELARRDRAAHAENLVAPRLRSFLERMPGLVDGDLDVSMLRPLAV